MPRSWTSILNFLDSMHESPKLEEVEIFINEPVDLEVEPVAEWPVEGAICEN